MSDYNFEKSYIHINLDTKQFLLEIPLMFSLKILYQAIILYEGLGKSLVMYILMGGVVSNLTSCMGEWSTAWRGLALTANSTCRPCFYHQEMEHGQQLILPDVLPLLDRQWQKSSSIFPSIEKEGEAILLGHLGISLLFPLVISFCIPSLHASKEIDSCFLLFHLLPNGI